MNTPNFVYAGAKAPAAFRINVTPNATVPDLSVVTAATCTVTRPDRTSATWPMTLSNQSSTTLKLTYVFGSDGSDVTQFGPHTLTVSLSTPAGTRRLIPLKLGVRDPLA